ncbi:Deoxyhypusine synthase [Saitoella coloradoensis]
MSAVPNGAPTQDDAAKAAAAVLVKSTPMPSDAKIIRGVDFEEEKTPITVQELMSRMPLIGFQGTALGRACEIVNEMRDWRPEPKEETVETEEEEPVQDSNEDGPVDEEAAAEASSYQPPQDKTTIFLGYTSNLISSGLRETIKYLAKTKQISCIVTTAGGVEEDFIKCLGPTYAGDFNLPGKDLRSKGLNRIGNLLVPNDNYCKFEDWVIPILDTMLEEQKTTGRIWTPSAMIRRLGKEINNEDSVYYWCYKNNIPVFCPAITDGSLGDMIYFHSFRNPGLIVDIARDIRLINTMAVRAVKTGMLILGGGVVKHHICNANLMRNGADYAVYINTGQEFDGSDAGARPDEAVSWGKIRGDGAMMEKVYADATIVFPLIVAGTFARHD